MTSGSCTPPANGVTLPALDRFLDGSFTQQSEQPIPGEQERLWCAVRDTLVSYDPAVGIIDSFPLPVCQFARAYRCRRFRGEASYGKDTVIRQTFCGFRLHARLCWPGVITRIEIAPASIHEGEVAFDLTPGTGGLLLGDRNYWLPRLKATLRQSGVILLTPFRTAKYAPAGSWSPVLGRVRYRIDTVFGQLIDRCQAKRVWARDRWHLCNRLLRMVLMHTLAVLFNLELRSSCRGSSLKTTRTSG